MLTNEQFDQTRRLALRLAGIELFERHRQVLERRIRRLGIHDGAGFDALLNGAEKGDTHAGRQLIGLFTTNFTGFFRHPWHFQLAAEHALRTVDRRGEACLWSAAAATGEEPYSLAMALIEVFQRDDPPASILATDVDADALAVARKGEYEDRTLRSPIDGDRESCGLSTDQVFRFFTRRDDSCWSVKPAVRRLVEFREINLAEVPWPVEGCFDVIFCRNVLMYLEGGRRVEVLERLASLMAPDGLLMLDPTEYPKRAEKWFSVLASGVYTPRREPSHGAARLHSQGLNL